MTTQPDALPACPSCGHISIGIETYVTDGFYAFCRSCHACGPYVSKEKAIAAFTRPAHAVAEVERLLREAREMLMRQHDNDASHVAAVRDLRIGPICCGMAWLLARIDAALTKDTP